MGEGVADFLSGIGVFQHNVMRRQVDGRETVAHIFESAVSSARLETEGFLNAVPVQVILIVKAKNQRKINSHRWIFNAIGRILNVSPVYLAFFIADSSPIASPKFAF
jgi:chitin synthase